MYVHDCLRQMYGPLRIPTDKNATVISEEQLYTNISDQATHTIYIIYDILYIIYYIIFIYNIKYIYIYIKYYII